MHDRKYFISTSNSSTEITASDYDMDEWITMELVKTTILNIHNYLHKYIVYEHIHDYIFLIYKI